VSTNNKPRCEAGLCDTTQDRARKRGRRFERLETLSPMST
jgi:hypothetical protein